MKASIGFLLRLLRTNAPLLGLLFVFAVLPLIFSSASIMFLYEHRDTLPGGPSAMVLFFGGSIVAMALALVPSTVVAVLAGFFFSWSGLAPTVGAYLAAAALGLILGRGLARFVNGNRLLSIPQVGAFFASLRTRELMLVIFGRLSPVLPFAMMNVALASIRVSWPAYLGGSLLGMFPRTFLFFYTGVHARDVWEFLRSPSYARGAELLPVVLVLVSTFGLLYLAGRAIRNMTRPEPRENDSSR